MMRRSWILRDLPVSPPLPSSVSSLPACWALAPAVTLPDAWQPLVDRAAAELDFDSRLWIAREQLWPLLGVASLAHMRRPRRATDYHGVQVPTAGAFPQLGADGGPGITPFWLFTAGERRRLLQDFPLPSPPYKSRAAKAPAAAVVQERVDAAGPELDAAAVGPGASPASTPVSGSDFRGPKAVPTEMLLLRDGVGWTTMPAEHTVIAALLAVNAHDGTNPLTSVPPALEEKKKKSQLQLMPPDCLLFVEGNLRDAQGLGLPSHLFLHNVQELPKTSTTMLLDGTLVHRRQVFAAAAPGGARNASTTPAPPASFELVPLDGETAFAAQVVRDQQRFSSFRWLTPTDVQRSGLVPPEAPATVSSDVPVSIAHAASSIVNLCGVVVSAWAPMPVVPLADLPDSVRQHYCKYSPAYARGTPSATAADGAASSLAFVRVNGKYAAGIAARHLDAFAAANRTTSAQLTSASTLTELSRRLSPEEGGLLFVPLKDISTNAFLGRNTEVTQYLADMDRGDVPRYALPMKLTTRLLNRDVLVAPPAAAAPSAAVDVDVGQDAGGNQGVEEQREVVQPTSAPIHTTTETSGEPTTPAALPSLALPVGDVVDDNDPFSAEPPFVDAPSAQQQRVVEPPTAPSADARADLPPPRPLFDADPFKRAAATDDTSNPVRGQWFTPPSGAPASTKQFATKPLPARPPFPSSTTTAQQPRGEENRRGWYASRAAHANGVSADAFAHVVMRTPVVTPAEQPQATEVCGDEPSFS
jgi:hypothetical protein